MTGAQYEKLSNKLNKLNAKLQCIAANTDADGNPVLALTESFTSGVQTLGGGAFATGILTFAANAADKDVIEIDGVLYTLDAVLTDSPFHVLIGAAATNTIDNLILAITRGAGEGVNYGTNTPAHSSVTAVAGAGDTMDVTALVMGTVGNAISTTDPVDGGGNLSWGATTLENGDDGGAFSTGSLVLTFIGQPVDGDALAIDYGSGVVQYMFETAFSDTSGYVLVGATVEDTIANLVAAINNGPGEGTVYGTGTPVDAYAIASAGTGAAANTLILTLNPGVAIPAGAVNYFPIENSASIEGGKHISGVVDGCPTYVMGPVAATNYFTISSNAPVTGIDPMWDGDTVTIGPKTYIFDDVLVDLPNHIQIEHSANATGTLTYAPNVNNGDTVTIGSVTYTFDTVLVDIPNHILIGAAATNTTDNFIAAINNTAGEGVAYGTGTVAHPQVTGANLFGNTRITSIIGGVVGNQIATTETSASASWGAATLTGGLQNYTTTIANFVDAINGTGVPGTDYGTGTSIHPDVTATQFLRTAIVTAKVPGSAANSIATTAVLQDPHSLGDSWGWNDPTMSGGSDGLNIRVVEIWMNSTTWYEVTITKTDGSTVVATNAAASRWEYASPTGEADIESVSICNLTINPTDYSVNGYSFN